MSQGKKSRRAFRFEKLEERLVMNGGNVVAAAIAAPVDLGILHVVAPTGKTAPSQDSSAADFPTRFKSEAEFNKWLLDAAVAQWGSLFGTSSYYPQWGGGGTIYLDDRALVLSGGMVAYNSTAFDGVAVASTNSAVSSTNVQVNGVDEADLVETDGNYLYILSGQDLVIVQAGVGDELRVASRVHFDEKPVGMYLSGNRLAIVSSSAPPNYSYSGGLATDVVLFNYGFPQTYEPTTTVTILDVTDRSAPSVVQKSQMDGQLVSSRVVDGELRLVLSNSINLPMPIAKPVDGAAPLQPVLGNPNAIDYVTTDYSQLALPTASVYESQAEYFARVKDEIFKSAMPKLRILGADGSVLEERALTDATDVYRPDSLFDWSLTTIATFDLNGDTAGPASTMSVVSGSSPQIYATDDSIYLFSAASNDGGFGYYNYGASSTNIQKFDFNPATHAITLAAKGTVDGQFANQFSADESDGYLRVVTSSGWGSAGQNVFVLQQVGRQLKVVGSVTGIAAGERLHAVRFMGDRAFIVTFRQVDPLFAVDLSDPTNPQLAGELTIPGVSGYLQPLDANHLLGVGRAMDQSGQMFGDLELSIFDITNLSDPQLSFRYSFDGGWSTTTPILADGWIPYTGDQHAAAYFPDAQIFAMPVYSTQGGNLDGVESTPVFEPGHGGLEVFRIDPATGFAPLAFIEHDDAIERAVEIGDRLFAISSGTVTVHDLTDPATQLGALEIGAGEGESLTELPMFDVPRPTFVAELTESFVSARPVARANVGVAVAAPDVERHVSGAGTFDRGVRAASRDAAILDDASWRTGQRLMRSAIELDSGGHHADPAANNEVFQCSDGAGQDWQAVSGAAVADSILAG